MKTLIVAVCIVAMAMLASCGSHKAPTTGGNSTTTGSPPASETGSNPQLVQQMVTAIQHAGMPIIFTFCYNEENDSNHLLGRPGGYIQKCNWEDGRLKGDDFDPATTKREGPDVDLGGSVELYERPGGAYQRLQELQGLRNGQTFLGSEWDWLVPDNSNLVLRVSAKLSKPKAEQYHREALKAFQTVMGTPTTS